MLKRNYLPVYKTNMWGVFVLLCIATLSLLLIKKSFIENETAAFEVLEMEGNAGFLHFLNTLQYLSIPVVYLFKFLIIAFLLWAGCFLFGYRLTFREAFQTAIIGEFIFLIPEFLKILYFLFIESDPTLFEVQSFYPLSLMNFADPGTLDRKWFYPMKAANLFEIAYWFLLVYLLHSVLRKSIKITAILVVVAYVVPFIGWLFYYAGIYKG
ncbi:hypothetical protein [Fulvivirga sedimenti]|uniref:Sulfate ABC transporter permease n=1 Tax=Fulvivirga sedimenti TaxID=2879465 RepID=A0A9X1HTP3_9BACT|nr:hypothetical protein [Fulvivirga sedimenti]MCA6078114.1 hypothetical protein [Fulvivirga sedimenti]